MSPEQAAGEREIDGRSDLYSLGIVTYQMLTGELPFTAPTVAGILMKQITEPAPDLRSRRVEVPEDLSLAVARCLEKDPENRWPTADALRRALESRTVTGYTPTGLGWRASRPHSAQPRPGARALSRSPARELGPSSRTGPAGRAGLPAPRPPASPRQWDRNWERRPGRRNRDEIALPDTGEPKIVQQVRARFASWAAVSLGCFGINLVAPGIVEFPWFLFPTFGMGIGLLKQYATLWQMGYSWRDVLSPPPAPGSRGGGGQLAPGTKLPRQVPLPMPNEFGEYYLVLKQLRDDRSHILRLVERLPAETRKDLADMQETVDGLYTRATDLARSLSLMKQDMSDENALARIDARIAELASLPEGDERTRQTELLQRQRDALAALLSRHQQLTTNLESCRLAMQNLRYDMLRLTTSDLGSAAGELSQVTQQARAVSRNVDHALAAAAEVKAALQ